MPKYNSISINPFCNADYAGFTVNIVGILNRCTISYAQVIYHSLEG